MRDALQNEYLEMRVTAYELSESVATERATVRCSLSINGEQTIEVVGHGVGIIDALFAGLKERYAPEYPSLESIKFSSFLVRGLVDDAQGSHADAKAEICVGVTNSYGKEFEFLSVSNSVSRSSVEAVLAAVAYFINGERAYVRLFKAYQHYKATGRVDLISKYTVKLAEMVKNTSYSSVIDRMKTEE
ncbi:MAG: hypothetical protein ACJAYU_000438 [Bradymonadia bacterium]|jgi:hypothetical protein